MVGPHEIDEAKWTAYHRSVEADKLAAQGRLEEARRVMAEAAVLDQCYSARAELLGRADVRRIQVSRTVGRTVVPLLLDAGFRVDGAERWSERHALLRLRGDVHSSVLIGRAKFGHQLGLLAARWRDPARVEYFDWKAIGNRSGTIAYRTQAELELACSRWCALISMHLLPWFEECECAAQQSDSA